MESGESTGTYLDEVRMAVFYAGFYATPAVEPFSLPWGEADHASLQYLQGLPWGDESGQKRGHSSRPRYWCSDTDIWGCQPLV